MEENQNMIHRNVKPTNILLSRQGLVKICDFHSSTFLANSIDGADVGCRPYMAPERLAGSYTTAYDIRSDVWSLGISMIEIAMGTHPYGHQFNEFEQLRRIIEEPSPQLPKRGNVTFSQEFHSFIEECLRKDFKNRPRYPKLLKLAWIESAKSLTDKMVGAFVSEAMDMHAKYKRYEKA